jgi:ABC-2 type transport system ATP-binding protein
LSKSQALLNPGWDAGEEENMETVKLISVRKQFGKVLAVKDASFEVYPGEIFGLLGPNGAGKTTAIRMMLDIFKPDSGQVEIFGGKMDDAKKKRIGYLPEERGLYKDLKLEQTLIFLATLKGMEEKQARERLESWLKRLDLWEHRTKKVQELSKGMQQKAQLIATLVHEPDLIVVDEPFSGLDPVNTRLVKDIIEEMRAAGKSIVMSTHQMHQVEALCNRIVLINKGESVLYGQVNKIKRDFAGNAVVVEGQGELTHLPGVLDIRRSNGGYHLSLQTGVDPQAVFRSLGNQDGFRVERYQIEEPSLEDIFVSIVQGDMQSREAEHA